MPKATNPSAESRQLRRHNPLEDDLLATGPLRSKPSKRKSGKEDHVGESYVDSRASRNILRIGQELADEEEKALETSKPNTAFDFKSRFEEEDDEIGYEDEEAWGDEEEVVEELELAPEDLETFSKFFPVQEDPLLRQGWGGAVEELEQEEGINLADLILAKIAAHEAAQEDQNPAGQLRNTDAIDEDYELPPKVIEVYSKIGLLLSRYKSGKLPKPFKILPTIPHWEIIFSLTRPDAWTPNACYEATKIFISAPAGVAQRFLSTVILERVRADIYETKKLNVHLFKALKKGLYKPAAWFKGFLFPLVASGSCTLREAHIISAVLARVSIPVLHSAAALKGLCDIAAQEAGSAAGAEGGGATNVFIRVLLEKKYALPYQVIDALVFHFLRFRTLQPAAGDGVGGDAEGSAKGTRLPVIWHQCLLSFAQRYRNDITEDQREALLDLLSSKGHSAIGPEVRRELLEGRGRGVPVEPEAVGDGGDDTMMLD